MLLYGYSRQALVLETRTAVGIACAGLGWCLVYIGSTLSFGCWAGVRVPPVLESSAPTADPGKLLSSTRRGNIAHRAIRVLL